MKKQTYSDPWDEIEARANNYSSQGLLAMVIVIIVAWALTVGGFFVVDKDMMTKAALIGILGFLSLRAILRIFDNSKRWLKYLVLSVICVLCGTIVAVLSFHAVLLYVIPLIFAAQYSKQHVIWCTLAVNGIMVVISSLVSFYYGLCDLNIFFVSNANYEYYSQIAANGFAGLETNPNTTFILIAYASFPRIMLLSLIAFMLSQITAKGRAEAAQMARTKLISETDFITGVFNKNKYAEMIESYYPKLDTVGVIFWDINNLKEVNDEYGHEMGDQIIIELAEALLAKSGDTYRVYRIGGDEFVSIIDNPSPGEEKKVEKEILKLLACTKSKADACVSVAHGTARGKGLDVSQVVNEADAAMYACKRKMKGENDESPR
ncbi:MAG: GGDEF domain-containing protein [Lachnospiraceae bacterium]|nr:GGDEF domain-containing protein [Lachnospiraceae bacterium]